MDRSLSAVVVVIDYFTINSVHLKDKTKHILCPEYRTLYENYGILVVTGGDSFELDHGSSSFLDFYYNRIKTVQEFDCFSNRVVLFNNTTNSVDTKTTQNSELLKHVENLKKTGQLELTQNNFKLIFVKMFKAFLSQHKDLLIKEWLNHPFFQRTDIEVLTFISSFKDRKNKQFNSVYNIVTTLNEIKGKTKFHYDLILFEDSEFVNKSMVEAFNSISCLKIDVIGFAINLENLCKLLKSRHDAVILVTSFSMLKTLDLHLALKDFPDFSEIKRKCILLVTYDPEFDTDVADSDIEILCKSQGEDFKYLWTQCEHRAVLFDTTTTDVLTKTEQMLNLLKCIVKVITYKTFEEIAQPYKLYKDDFNTTWKQLETSESGGSKHIDTDTETSHKKQRRKHRLSKFTKMKTSIDRDELKKEKHEIDMEIKRLKKQHWEIKIAKLQKRRKVKKEEFNKEELVEVSTLIQHQHTI
ncbi:uncharacterized protein LOC131927662 [Physella acuta]|uniref:uncharacterized protein LOC131927662 n=1 Tax=Physella acuta TaxID=109671 RepID=UPI0027DB91CC|nr:uncharacterized protein LOC131927662 [Physella acuta]